MTSHVPELQAVMRRLEKLEKENKRLRVAGVALLLFALTFVAVAAQTGRRTLTANEFILQDDQGRARAKLAVDSKRVALMFLDQTGSKQMSLASYNDTLGHGHASLALGERAVSARLVLASTTPDEWGIISDGGLFLAGTGTTRIVLSASGPEAPSLEVADSQGYAAELGVSKQVYSSTGGMQKSSAASLILLDKERKVIWSAP